MNKVSFIITTGKLLLQLFILLIHYITRTPLIVIYYGMACYGLFGSPSQTTSYCFYLCFSLFLINLLLVILFNSQKTKQKCIDLVGKEYYEEYMSHSQAAAKSLLRLGSGLLYPCGVELVTSAHSYYNFHSTTDKIRGDLKYHLNFINNKESRQMAAASQQLLNTTIANYRPGGLVTTILHSEVTVEGYRSASQAVTSSVRAVWGKVSGK